MKPVNQTRFGSRGNCLLACIASVMELSLDQVVDIDWDDFTTTEDYWNSLRAWLQSYGLGVILATNGGSYIYTLPGYHIIIGEMGHTDKPAPGPVFPEVKDHKEIILHATIWKDRVMIHDPDPRNAGIKDLKGAVVLYPLNPSQRRKRG